jgi:hypothetical protein
MSKLPAFTCRAVRPQANDIHASQRIIGARSPVIIDHKTRLNAHFLISPD